jgi:hypothetical protein
MANIKEVILSTVLIGMPSVCIFEDSIFSSQVYVLHFIFKISTFLKVI